MRQPPPFARTVAAVDYAFPWNRLIARLKFHDGVGQARVLAACMATVLQADATTVDWLLPVPLSAARARQRGHNQAWELARPLARHLGRTARADLLLRTRDTEPQSDLPRAQRLRNLRGAFAVTPAGRRLLPGQRIALVDDVMTTGSTVGEAAATLLRAGAASVSVWVLARASGD